ncbi:MAG TPA: antibiotic biosynthesis monooxygenase [Solirubrobacteraceae bacterium]|jgi:quinol monooxygenase YgiN|nr:antibiotic biosynthesis monooxygenase [Solirubrobacteraceae bacterium]
MTVYAIWESRFPAESADQGVEATKQIWADMRDFTGYVGHELVQDLDEPGHLVVLARWDSREAADAAMGYATHANARRVDQLVSEPRRRTVAAAL